MYQLKYKFFKKINVLLFFYNFFLILEMKLNKKMKFCFSTYYFLLWIKLGFLKKIKFLISKALIVFKFEKFSFKFKFFCNNFNNFNFFSTKKKQLRKWKKVMMSFVNVKTSLYKLLYFKPKFLMAHTNFLVNYNSLELLIIFHYKGLKLDYNYGLYSWRLNNQLLKWRR